MDECTPAPEHYKGKLVEEVCSLSNYAGKERWVSFLSDRSRQGGAHGPTCCGCQFLDLCIQSPDYPLHGFTALIKNRHKALINRREYKRELHYVSAVSQYTSNKLVVD